jgi:hypothetical protein
MKRSLVRFPASANFKRVCEKINERSLVRSPASANFKRALLKFAEAGE